jgi:hypothetical protein
MRVSLLAKGCDAAVEHHSPGKFPHEQLWVPLDLLADCEGKRNDPVELEQATKGRVLAGWTDGIPQRIQYHCPEPWKAEEFPARPEHFAQNPPDLPVALDFAAATTDPDAVRYALGCIRLSGKSGQLAATDGRQIYLHGGFSFFHFRGKRVFSFHGASCSVAGNCRRTSRSALAVQGIEYRKWCPKHGIVANDAIIKGYPYGTESYVQLAEEELTALQPADDKTLTLERFFDPDQLDSFHREMGLGPRRPFQQPASRHGPSRRADACRAYAVLSRPAAGRRGDRAGRCGLEPQGHRGDGTHHPSDQWPN